MIFYYRLFISTTLLHTNPDLITAITIESARCLLNPKGGALGSPPEKIKRERDCIA
jgi:hypothetical protein